MIEMTQTMQTTQQYKKTENLIEILSLTIQQTTLSTPNTQSSTLAKQM